MANISWYWHRLRAMSPGEMLSHARKKWRQQRDRRGFPDWRRWPLQARGDFPPRPDPASAPPALRAALGAEVEPLLAGRWPAFGHLPLRVDDPPRWQKDYLAGQDVTTSRCAFGLNHRQLPAGADSKLIWELSRWYALVRLAMAGHVLGDARAGAKVQSWLEDWVHANPAYVGWNWTSALEGGIRLVQFAWLDALAGPVATATWRERLVYEILPAHAHFVWRHQSFGSSANNHLLGELVGLIVAVARWPGLASWAAPLEELQRRWEAGVLAQFAPDGGNREQALNYQLFSWEFCWQARAALMAVGRTIPASVEARLRQAADFFLEVQVPSDPWDYGDSDNAFVTPVFGDWHRVVPEWHAWLTDRAGSPAIDYWWGPTAAGAAEALPARAAVPGPRQAGWRARPESGQWTLRDGPWVLRLDASPLGYLRTAAHGHLDALHLSVWLDGVALVIDPGTGAYYAEPALRRWLASRAAHNGPCPLGVEEWPRRAGPFLWGAHHAIPGVQVAAEGWQGELSLPADGAAGWPAVRLTRRVMRRADGGWEVEDGSEPGRPFGVRWQFAPGSRLERLGGREFRVTRGNRRLGIQVGADWTEVIEVAEAEKRAATDPEAPLAGLVSPGFRKTEWAPYLKLVARPGDRPCVFRTAFLASARA